MLAKCIFNGQETVILSFTGDLFVNKSSIVHKEARRIYSNKRRGAY